MHRLTVYATQEVQIVTMVECATLKIDICHGKFLKASVLYNCSYCSILEHKTQQLTEYDRIDAERI